MNKEEIQKLKDILWANTWSDEQIIREGIATLQNSFNLEDEGFRRIESAGLLAIYTLQHQLEEKDKVIAEAINKIETLRMEKWSIMGTDIMEILDILERGKNGK